MVLPGTLPLLLILAIAAVPQPGATSRAAPAAKHLGPEAPAQEGTQEQQGSGRSQHEALTLRGGARNETPPAPARRASLIALAQECTQELRSAARAALPAVFLQSAQATRAAHSPVRGLVVTTLSHPDECLAYVIAGVAAAFVIWAYGFAAGAARDERRARVQEELAELEQSYLASAVQLEEQLQGMEECSALQAERNFEGKVRSFRKFLHSLRQDPGAFLGKQPQGPLLEPLRAFVRHWLQVFGRCTPRPRAHRLEIVRDDELSACADVPALARLLCKRLDDCEVNLLSKSLRRAEALVKLKPLLAEASDVAEKPRHHSCTWFRLGSGSGLGWSRTGAHGETYPVEMRLGLCSVALLSDAHVLLLCSLAKCLALLTLEACLGKLGSVALLLAAAGGFVAAGLRIERVSSAAAAERRLGRLREASEELAEVGGLVSDFQRHRQEVTELWQMHAEPRLEHLEELFERLGDAPEELRLELLQACNACLDAVVRGMGPLDAWVGPDSCAWRARDLGCRQLRTHTDSIAAAHVDGSATQGVLERLRQPIFGLVVVRVHSAMGLRRADFTAASGRSDPYVTCTIGAQEARTYHAEDSLNPVWDSEPFLFELRSGDSELELTVWDEDSFNKRECLGQAVLDVRGLPRGSWEERRTPLQPDRSSPVHTPRSSTPRSSTPRGSAPRASTPRASTPRASTPRALWRASIEAISPISPRVVRGELCFEAYYADAVPQMAWESSAPLDA